MMVAAVFVLLRLASFKDLLQYSQSCEITSINDWIVFNNTGGVSLKWQAQLAPFDGLLAAYKDTIMFYRPGSGNSSCEGRLITLDGLSGQLKRTYPAILVRRITTTLKGYVIASCCTRVLLLEEAGEKLWQTQEFSTKDPDPHLRILENQIDLISDIGTYEIALQDGGLIRQSKSADISSVTEGEFPSESRREGLQFQVYRYKEWQIGYDDRHILVSRMSDDGKVWETSKPRKSNPILIGDRLLIYGQDDSLLTLDVATGQTKTLAFLAHSPRSTTHDDWVYLAHSGTMLYILYPEAANLLALQLDLTQFSKN
jgi:hypothetical protein